MSTTLGDTYADDFQTAQMLEGLRLLQRVPTFELDRAYSTVFGGLGATVLGREMGVEWARGRALALDVRRASMTGANDENDEAGR